MMLKQIFPYFCLYSKGQGQNVIFSCLFCLTVFPLNYFESIQKHRVITQTRKQKSFEPSISNNLANLSSSLEMDTVHKQQNLAAVQLLLVLLYIYQMTLDKYLLWRKNTERLLENKYCMKC